MAMGTALSRLTGFAALAALAATLGFTRLTDTYNLANTTPNIVYELLLGGVLSATLVPAFVEHRESGDVEATSAVVSVAAAALAALTVVSLLVTPLVARLYATRMGESTAAAQAGAARSLLFLLIPQVFLYGCAALVTALLHARRRFAAAAFAPVLANVARIALFVVIGLVVTGSPTLDGLARDRRLLLLLGLGTTASVAVMVVALIPSLFGAGVRLRPHFDWRHPAVRKVVRLSGWTVAYVAVNQAALWVVLLLASSRPGGVATYQGAFVFFQLPHGLFAVSLMTTIVPELSRLALRNDMSAFRARFTGGFRLLWLLVLPAAAGYLILARPIVGSLLQRGALTPGAADATASVLVALAVGLPGFSVYLYVLRGFYALGDTRTPFLLAALENILNVAFALALSPRFGVVGLAVAYSIAYAISAVLALIVLGRRVGRLADGRTAKVLIRVGAAVLVMAVAVIAVGAPLRSRPWLVQTVLGVATGIAAYGAMALILHVPELQDLRRVARAHLSRSARSG